MKLRFCSGSQEIVVTMTATGICCHYDPNQQVGQCCIFPSALFLSVAPDRKDRSCWLITYNPFDVWSHRT